jgi:hypothetical protein
MPSDEFIAHRRGQAAHLKEIGWERYFGTTTSGNLPQFKATSNPCDVDINALNSQLVADLDIKESSFRFYHIKCHHAEESGTHEVLDRGPLSPTFGQMITIPGGEIDYHTVTSGIMIKHNKGSKYGWLCVDDNCPYYQNTGRRYFYY